jgi:hypothetical protein
MNKKLSNSISRFLIRSFRIAIGIAILMLVFYCATIAREIATSTISFSSLSAIEILSFMFLSVLSYLFIILIWPIAFGKDPIDLAKAQSKGKRIKKRTLEFLRQWIRG